jgi:SNF2 family DNA or RNA helicase
MEEEKILCNKCGVWVSRKVFNNMHQLSCDFIDKDKPQPHVPKVLVTDADWEGEFCRVLGKVVIFKPWQVDGAKTLLSEHFLDRDTTILADEMGLGKTLTTLMVMLMVHRSASLRLTLPGRYDRWTSGVYLVVCPKSTVHDVWNRQPREYTPGVDVLSYLGPKRGAALQQALLTHVGGKSKNLVKLLNGSLLCTSDRVLIVVTTWDTCANDFGLQLKKGKGGAKSGTRGRARARG